MAFSFPRITYRTQNNVVVSFDQLDKTPQIIFACDHIAYQMIRTSPTNSLIVHSLVLLPQVEPSSIGTSFISHKLEFSEEKETETAEQQYIRQYEKLERPQIEYLNQKFKYTMQAFRTKQSQMATILWKVKLVKFLTTSFISYCYQNVLSQFQMSNSFDEMQLLSQSILFNLFK